jgi:outer membrane protein TolC
MKELCRSVPLVFMPFVMPRSFLFLLLAALLAPAAQAQPGAAQPVPVVLTLEEAIEIAVERGYAVRTSALDVANARAQVREAWGQVLPGVSASGSYTRNVVAANPFAGSDAGGLFGALGALDWLAYNETARTDGDPTTEPISLDEFRRRQGEGLSQAGVSLSQSDNPFAVPNQFQGQLQLTQTIYNGSAFAAIRGARSLEAINEAALTQRQHETIHQTRELFYTALLAQEQAAVARASVSRARETVSETTRRVSAGTLPLLERLSAEVEETNLESQRVQAENQAALAGTQLLFALGLPVSQPMLLRGSLELPAATFTETVALADAAAVALERRPEVEQARLAVDLQGVNRDITRAASLPTVSAFASVGILGNVPDDRTLVLQGRQPGDPFAAEVERRGFFSSSYWNPTVAVGASLSWNLFDGFQTRYRVQQNTIAIQQAQVALEQAEQAVVLEVDAAIRNLGSARQRISAQRENVERAETAYTFASTRLSTGAATQIDVRFASSQLDQARLGYLQAVYDFLVARSALERATGVVLPDPIPASRYLTSLGD